MPEEITQDNSATEVTEEAAKATTEAAEVDGAEALGDPGKKALEAMKQQRAEAKAEARELRQKLEALEQQFAAQGKPAEEVALEQARNEARKEAIAAANARILKAEIKSLAAGKLADPADALTLLDLSSFDVSDSGDVDGEAISDAIAALLEKKPYLGAQQKAAFAANDTGATRKGAEGPAQLSEEQVKQLYAAKDYAAIEKARAAGQLTNLLSK